MLTLFPIQMGNISPPLSGIRSSRTFELGKAISVRSRQTCHGRSNKTAFGENKENAQDANLQGGWGAQTKRTTTKSGNPILPPLEALLEWPPLALNHTALRSIVCACHPIILLTAFEKAQA